MHEIQKIAFLDRDGVLNKDTGYPAKFSENIANDKMLPILKYLAGKKYKLIIVSNQSGIARGLLTEKQVRKFNFELSLYYSKFDIKFDDIYICPHLPLEARQQNSISCKCRKPLTGMFEMAKLRHPACFKDCIMIGDKETDIIPAMKLNFSAGFYLRGEAITLNPRLRKWKGLKMCDTEEQMFRLIRQLEMEKTYD